MLAQYLSYEFIALFMFITMLTMMFTGQRVFGAIGFVAAASALLIWGEGSMEMPYTATWKLFKWYPMLTLPLFIYMGFMISESGIANDLYKMFHVYFGGLKGGLAIGTMLMMVAISAMNGLSVAGMAIGATIALPEMLKRNYDKRMITGVVQAGSSLGILIPPSVVMVLYGMIARQPVSKLWLAGLLPGILMASLFIIYIYVRCRLQPELGPALDKKERDMPLPEKLKLLKAGIIPFVIFFLMTGLFLMGIASLVECSEVGALLYLISDKIFVSTLLIWMTFTFDSLLILVSCILIVTRELSISYLRLFLVTKLNDFNDIKSDLAGKIKTSFQMIGLGLVLISPKMSDIFWIISLGILTLSAFLSWYSFFSYINKRRILGR